MKRFVILTYLFGSALLLNAQNLQTIKLNPCTPSSSTKKTFVQNHNVVTFMIEGLNPIKYDISIDGNLMNFKEEVPDFEEKIFGPTEDDLLNAVKFLGDLNNILGAIENSQCVDTKVEKDRVLAVYSELIPLFSLTSSTQLTDTVQIKLRFQEMVESCKAPQCNSLVKEYSDNYAARLKAVAEKLNRLFIPTQTTLPIQVRDADAVQFKVDVKDVQSNSEKSYIYEFPVRGGFTFSASSGIFISSFGKSNYFVEKSTVDSTKNIIRNDKLKGSERFTPNLGIMVSFYPRQIADIQWAGINFGAMTSENIKLFAGTGISFGSNNRLILSTGLTFGETERLKSKYNIDQLVDLDINDSDLVEKKNKVGYYFGLAYSLNRKKEVVGSQED